METQRYLLRNSSIQQNCISAIQQLPANPDKPIEIVIQNAREQVTKTAVCGRFCTTSLRKLPGYGQKYSPDDWKDLITALVAKTKTNSSAPHPVSAEAWSCSDRGQAKCG